MNLYELGLALKNARINKEITQQELAEKTGLSVSTISGLERGTLAEIGVVKLLQLFAQVSLELQPRPAGQRRTLDDVVIESASTRLHTTGHRPSSAVKKNALAKQAFNELDQTRQRVRASSKKGKK